MAETARASVLRDRVSRCPAAVQRAAGLVRTRRADPSVGMGSMFDTGSRLRCAVIAPATRNWMMGLPLSALAD